MSNWQDEAFVAANSIDPARLEAQDDVSETDYFGVPCGCHWESQAAKEEDFYDNPPPVVPSPVKIDLQMQTNSSLPEDLFELVVFDLELMELIGSLKPVTLTKICKIVISPTAVLEARIEDPGSARCYDYGNEKCTMTAESSEDDLVRELLFNLEIASLVNSKNAELMAKLCSVYGTD